MGFAVNGELPGGDKIINSLYQPLLKRWVPAIFHPLKCHVLGGPIPSAYRAVGAHLPSREVARFSRREVHCRRKWGTGLNEVC